MALELVGLAAGWIQPLCLISLPTRKLSYLQWFGLRGAAANAACILTNAQLALASIHFKAITPPFDIPRTFSQLPHTVWFARRIPLVNATQHASKMGLCLETGHTGVFACESRRPFLRRLSYSLVRLFPKNPENYVIACLGGHPS